MSASARGEPLPVSAPPVDISASASPFLGTPFCPLSLDELYDTARRERGVKNPSLPALLSTAAKASRLNCTRLQASALQAKRTAEQLLAVVAECRKKARGARRAIQSIQPNQPQCHNENTRGRQDEPAAEAEDARVHTEDGRRHKDDTIYVSEVNSGSQVTGYHKERVDGEGLVHACSGQNFAEEPKTGLEESTSSSSAAAAAAAALDTAQRATKRAQEAELAAIGAEITAGFAVSHGMSREGRGMKRQKAMSDRFHSQLENPICPATGWTPASFQVAAAETGKAYGDEEGATRLLQRPEDFMDEEDLADAEKRQGFSSSVRRPFIVLREGLAGAETDLSLDAQTRHGRVRTATTGAPRDGSDSHRSVSSEDEEQKGKEEKGRGSRMRADERASFHSLQHVEGARDEAFCRTVGWLHERFQSRAKAFRMQLERDRRVHKGKSEAKAEPRLGRRVDDRTTMHAEGREKKLLSQRRREEKGKKNEEEEEVSRTTGRNESGVKERRSETSKLTDTDRSGRESSDNSEEGDNDEDVEDKPTKKRCVEVSEGEEGETKRSRLAIVGPRLPAHLEELRQLKKQVECALPERQQQHKPYEENESGQPSKDCLPLHGTLLRSHVVPGHKSRQKGRDDVRVEAPTDEDFLSSLLMEEQEEYARIASQWEAAQNLIDQAVQCNGTDTAGKGGRVLGQAAGKIERDEETSSLSMVSLSSSSSRAMSHSVKDMKFGGRWMDIEREGGRLTLSDADAPSTVFVVEDSDDEDRLIYGHSAFDAKTHFTTIQSEAKDQQDAKQARTGVVLTEEDAKSQQEEVEELPTLGKLFSLQKMKTLKPSTWYPPPSPPPWFDGRYVLPPFLEGSPSHSSSNVVSSRGVGRLSPPTRAHLLSLADQDRSEKSRMVTDTRSEEGKEGSAKAAFEKDTEGRRETWASGLPGYQLGDRSSGVSTAEPSRHQPLWQGVSQEKKAEILSQFLGKNIVTGQAMRRLPAWTKEGELYPQAAHLERHQKLQLQQRTQAELKRRWFLLQRELRGLRDEIDTIPGRTMRWNLYCDHLQNDEEREANPRASNGLTSSSPVSSSSLSSKADMAAQDPEELHQFRLWHRRLRRIDKELQETRSEAAKCAAEAWREGSFGCRFSAASEKEDETESEEMPHRQREAYRRGHGGRIDSGAEEREQKSSHPPIAEETDDGSKEEEERRKTQSERQRKEQRRENNAGEREEREETGRKPLATNEDGIEEAEQEETKKEEMLATRSYHEGGGEARGSMSERALKDSDRSKADSSFRGKFRGAPGQDEKKRTEKKRKREERCLSKENSVERDQQQEGSDYTCGTINEEEKKGTGISLEKMLPLLRSRRTSCNWAPDPRLCRAFGLPDPWSRMPFFDDRKYTAEELKVLLHQRDQLGRQGEMKVQAGSDSVTADTPESIPPSLPSGTSETHSEVGRSVSPPRAARAENHDSEVVGKKSIGGPQHPLVIQSGVITQEHEMPVKTKSSVIPPVKLFKAIFDADASGTSSDSSDEEESDKE